MEVERAAEVRGVVYAYRHLVEWPVSLREAAHAVALKARGAALCGEIEAETARRPKSIAGSINCHYLLRFE
ncbi:hypothetical protein ASC97_22515 [Rhizobium sp. Root1203]|nr:hypothetical protein ASC97_22515 [Rhizobium sp. Root1203]